MLTILLVLVIFFILANITHASAIIHAYQHKGIVAALKLLLSYTFHEIAGLFFS